MSDFLPANYEIPKSPSGYMKFEQGLNRIRILSSAIVGYEYFTTENKPVRSRETFEDMPTDIKQGGKVKAFWAFVVWDYATDSVKILEITQKGIMTSIKSLVDNPKWGSPMKYDIAIMRSGEGMDTEYTVQGEPPISEPSAEILSAYASKTINLNALYEGTDPFSK